MEARLDAEQQLGAPLLLRRRRAAVAQLLDASLQLEGPPAEPRGVADARAVERRRIVGVGRVVHVGVRREVGEDRVARHAVQTRPHLDGTALRLRQPAPRVGAPVELLLLPGGQVLGRTRRAAAHVAEQPVDCVRRRLHGGALGGAAERLHQKVLDQPRRELLVAQVDDERRRAVGGPRLRRRELAAGGGLVEGGDERAPRRDATRRVDRAELAEALEREVDLLRVLVAGGGADGVPGRGGRGGAGGPARRVLAAAEQRADQLARRLGVGSHQREQRAAAGAADGAAELLESHPLDGAALVGEAARARAELRGELGR